MNRIGPCFILSVLPILHGCATHAQQGALVGSGMGALTGAALACGNPAEGALIGGLVGAAAGTVIGDSQDARDERDAALVHAARVESAAQGLSNHDILNMAANGLGEEVILTSIHTRGGRFDVSPNALVNLKAAGVSDRVIQAMQSTPAMGPFPPTLVAGPPPVILEPAPRVDVGFFVGPIGRPGPGPYFHHRHRRHW